MCLEEQPSQVVTQLYYASVHTKPSVKHAHWLQLLPQQTQGCARTHTDTRTHTHRVDKNNAERSHCNKHPRQVSILELTA